jgi:transcriptional regulator with XRE-family HTH domain
MAFHVAENAIHLRKFRRKSQKSVGDAMGTSQSAIARIEGGDDNITLWTLKRLALALRGRIRFAIEPEEANLPQLPRWWDIVDSGLSSTSAWTMDAAERRDVAESQAFAALWSADTLPAKRLLSSAGAAN